MSKKNSTKPIFFAFLGNLMVAILKFAAASISNSAVMFSEALHSVADTANQIFLFFGIKMSQRPATHEHQFGFGKERFFWSLIAAFGILIIGSVLSIQKGLETIRHPEEITNIVLPMAVIIISLFIEGYTLTVAYGFINEARGKKSFFRYLDDSAETTSITVFFEDLAAVLGLTIAGTGIYLSYITGNSFYDGVTSIIIGVLLGCIAIFLVDKNKDFLTDQSHIVVNKEIEAIFFSHPAVEKYHDLRTIIFGPDHVVVVCEVEFKEEFIYENLKNTKDRKKYTEFVIKRIGLLIDQLEFQIRNVCPDVREIYLEVEQGHNKVRFDKKIAEKIS